MLLRRTLMSLYHFSRYWCASITWLLSDAVEFHFSDADYRREDTSFLDITGMCHFSSLWFSITIFSRFRIISPSSFSLDCEGFISRLFSSRRGLRWFRFFFEYKRAAFLVRDFRRDYLQRLSSYFIDADYAATFSSFHYHAIFISLTPVDDFISYFDWFRHFENTTWWLRLSKTFHCRADDAKHWCQKYFFSQHWLLLRIIDIIFVPLLRWLLFSAITKMMCHFAADDFSAFIDYLGHYAISPAVADMRGRHDISLFRRCAVASDYTISSTPFSM